MQVQLKTDRHIEGSEELSRRVERTVEAALGRFDRQITRVAVHCSDVNGQKGGAGDKQCAIEARPAGMNPLAAKHRAATLDDAVAGAAEKLGRLLDSTFGRLRDGRDRTAVGDVPAE